MAEGLASAPGIEHFLFVGDLKPLVYVGMLLAAAALVHGLYRYYGRWSYGGQRIRLQSVPARLKRLAVYSLLQRKVVAKPLEGLIHVMVFAGFLGLFAATLLRAFEYDVYLRIRGEPYLVGAAYLVFKLMANVAGLLALAGIVLAAARRALRITRDLPTSASDYLLLADLAAIIVTGFLLDGLATAAYRMEQVGAWDPVGYIVARAVEGMSVDELASVYRPLWLLHMVLALGTVALMPYTKLSHVIVGGLVNIFLSRLEHPSAFKPIPDIEKRVEAGEALGVVKLVHTSWKQRVDYDACVRCARCHNACPANLSGKPLSPMDLVTKLRELMDKGAWEEQVIPKHVEPDVVWSCVTCGACVYECPMLVHHVETLIDLRRGLLYLGENVPDELLQVSYNIMRAGNPYAMNPADREAWLRRLAEEGVVEIAREGVEYDYLYWTGCNVSYDPNARGSGEALLRLLRRAGFKVAVLLEERCCGEPARRIGDELMFVEAVKANGETLLRYKFKKLLVSCPHGYNAFKHEYPQYGYRLEVVHHAQLLSEILRRGLVRPSEPLRLVATYHDPCYLGRWNGVYEEPREVLRHIPGLELKEMPRSRARSFCCGGGGGHAFFEVRRGERVSRERMREVKSVGASVVFVACPFCNIMLKSEAADFGVEVYDISEALLKSLEGFER